MPSPIEQRAYAFIEKYPALRVALLFTALIGIAKGAYDAIQPLLTMGTTIAVKHLPISPTEEETERYRCAITIPQRLTTIQLFVVNATELQKPTDHHITLLRNYQRDIATCQEVLGLPNRMTYVRGSNSAQDVKVLVMDGWHEVLQAEAALKGHLLTRDRPAALLFLLSSELEEVWLWLNNCDILTGCNLESGLDTHLKQSVLNIEYAYQRLDSSIRYRLPELTIAKLDKISLKSSIECFRSKLEQALGVTQPERATPESVAPTPGMTMHTIELPANAFDPCK